MGELPNKIKYFKQKLATEVSSQEELTSDEIIKLSQKLDELIVKHIQKQVN